MELPNVHDKEYWLQELRPLLDELHFAFRTALPKALEFFDVYRKKPINGPLLSNLIRYEVIEYLKSHGISAREEDDAIVGPLDGCGMNSLANNGIELIYRGSCIRLRKGTEPPMPTTDSQKDWYQQRLFEDDASILTNLLVLWYSDGQRKFGGLTLLRTKRVLRKSVACDWRSHVDSPPLVLNVEVGHEYSSGYDLPLSQEDQDNEENLRDDSTGTDDGN